MGEISLDSIMQKMLTTGFQATNVGLAINEINRMVRIRVLNITCICVIHTHLQKNKRVCECLLNHD